MRKKPTTYFPISHICTVSYFVMFLSIVVTVYNKELYLQRCLESCLKQVGADAIDYEILVVNDGSNDRSIAIIREFIGKNNNIRLLDQANQGLSMARNNGATEAQGDYVWFVDADDAISPNAVRLINDAAQRHPDVIPIYACTDGIEKVRNVVDVKVQTGKEVLLGRWEHCGVFWVIKREYLLANELRFLPGIYHEDAEFTPRMLYGAQSVRVVPEILYTVYRDPNSITQVPRPKRAFDCLTVAKRLNEFTEEHNERGTALGRVLDNNTSVIINNGFAVICKNNSEEQCRFNKTFRSLPELLRPLKAAPQTKYRFEAVLFRLFPNHCVNVYKLMKLFG